MAFEHGGLEAPEDYVPGEEPSHVGAPLKTLPAIEGGDAGDGVPDTLELDASPPKRLALVATGLFLGACAAGFGVVWLLSQG